MRDRVEVVVSYEKRDQIAFIALNRPEVHNALSPESIRELSRIWQDFSLDRTLRVGVLSGKGRSFCAGMDIRRTDPGFGPRGQAENPDSWTALLGEKRKIQYVAPETLHKPLIAAIQGVALGGGLELALASDIRIGAHGSRYGLPEVSRGLVPGSGGMYWLPRIIGMGPAMEMLLTGRVVEDQEALQLRLVNRLVPPDELLATAIGIAEQIRDNAPLAVQAVKETTRRILADGPEEGLAWSEQQVRMLRFTEDVREGAEAFEEKRAPNYRGR